MNLVPSLVSLIKRSPMLKRMISAALKSLHYDFKRMTEIPEITPINGRCSAHERPRLNLLVPTIAAQQLFGGVATALHFFGELADASFDLRIIVTDDDSHDAPPPSMLPGWRFSSAEYGDSDNKQIIPFACRHGRSLFVRHNDIFIATAWWTAYLGQRLASWQASQFSCRVRPMIYLIQDFEPGFYPWSARYLLAQSTYSQREVPLMAVFNTSLLQEYLQANGFSFDTSYAFEPRLHPQLQRALLSRQGNPQRDRKIIFYGRPTVDRNAFPIILQALHQWSAQDARASRWQVISIGEDHPPVRLSHSSNLSVSVKGKMSLEDYAALMSEAAIGISLMVSPHPSYPPLEMAAFGMRVISNHFAAKQLDQWSANIHSIPDITPEKIATTLSLLIDEFEANRQSWPIDTQLANSDYASTHNAYPFRNQLINKLKSRLRQT